MRQRLLLPIGIVLAIVTLIVVGVIYTRGPSTDSTEIAAPGPSPSMSLASPTPEPSASPTPIPSSNPSPDLSTDESGLSKATVVLATSQGVIKFKFYPQDAPNTVKRIVELISQGFYTGLSWHRVVPGFVIQGGDPQNNGTGGSGKPLKAEFNDRRHIEGAVAMARGSDPDSADSQFYITLGTFPHLDHSYTVFGQVIQGIDVARKIKPGDKINWMVVE
jgi:cyclophilin family peptidyl-prolyl cis-trans isomerase